MENSSSFNGNPVFSLVIYISIHPCLYIIYRFTVIPHWKRLTKRLNSIQGQSNVMPITMDFFWAWKPYKSNRHTSLEFWRFRTWGLHHFKGGMLVLGSVILTESTSPGRWKRRWRRSQFWAWRFWGKKHPVASWAFSYFFFWENKSFTGGFFWRKIWAGGCFCWMVKASQVLIWKILFVIFVIGFAHVISVHVFFWLCNRGQRVVQ